LLASRLWELPLDVLGELPLDEPQSFVDALDRRPPHSRQEARRLRIRHKPFAIEWLS
ncbi:antibiotic acetyltransferase, partial [Pseudomonas shirazica]